MESLIQNIDKLISGTQNGKIKWEKMKENFIWKTFDSSKKPINIVLQPKTINSNVNNSRNIMFRMWDVNNQIALLEVHTENSDEKTKGKILELYNTTKEYFDFERLDILSDILKDI
ncbi:hypothetical protein SAMN06265349_101689 [Flavobacterium resistens]|uniref:Uncharacterized protein n=1 Tax=Flavobacterium resistens TaxID=443612 RepID=A0A521B6A5_9FLAO|nr:hypothetical protein [Flavobacterium resistens]MRX70306.1 hypothetical protein [Flavobacterium resistens]SMO42190.1 hypothetical protein SAMN06265349_101689 [Flavobacterium resistens]